MKASDTPATMNVLWGEKKKSVMENAMKKT